MPATDFMQSFRIAFVSADASPPAAIGSGGAEGRSGCIAQVARSLAEAGHQVDILTRRDDPRRPAAVYVSSGMRVLHLDAGPRRAASAEESMQHSAEFTRSACGLLRNSVPYDVVHADSFISGLVGLQLKTLFGVPLVASWHAPGASHEVDRSNSDTLAAARADIRRRIVRQADRLIAECPRDFRDLVGLYGALPWQVSIVPCGLDTDELAPARKALTRKHVAAALSFVYASVQFGPAVPASLRARAPRRELRLVAP